MRNTDKYNEIEIGKRLKEARDSIGRTLKEMGKISGLATSTIHSMEVGKSKPNMKYMYLLSTKYNVNLDWIVTGQGGMFAPKLDLTWKYGEDSERILEIIYLIENYDTFRYAILSHYSVLKQSDGKNIERTLSKKKND